MRKFRISISAMILAASAGGCGMSEADYTDLESPHPEIKLQFATSDLGACCSTKLFLAGEVFGQNIPDLAVITGSMDIRYEWVTPATLKITTCDARSVEHRSGFRERDYSESFTLIVENMAPSDRGNGYSCEDRMPEAHQQLWPANATQ